MTRISEIIDRVWLKLFPEPPEELDQEILAQLRSRLNRPQPCSYPGQMELPPPDYLLYRQRSLAPECGEEE